MHDELKARIARMRGQLDGQHRVKEVHVSTQLFITPDDTARHVAELADLHNGHDILEPSVGTGALLRAAIAEAPDARYEAVELNGVLFQHLRKDFPGVTIFNDDFLRFQPDYRFDRILMNPPFGHGADIHHVLHAVTLLKPGGNVVAICTDGPRQRRKLEPLAEYLEPLPPGSFSYTDVRTMIVQIFVT